MKLWETYFRLWDRVSDTLTERSTQMKPTREEERGSSYYGYVCDVGTCIESGV
jgi:hypothetical protein